MNYSHFPKDVQKAYEFLCEKAKEQNLPHFTELLNKQDMVNHIPCDMWNEAIKKERGLGIAIENSYIRTIEYYMKKTNKDLFENYLPPSTQEAFISNAAEFLGLSYMDKGLIYCLDVGVLLTPDDCEYHEYNYVYDEQYGYYDENQIAYREQDLQKAIAYAKDYVNKGVDMTYAIITSQGILEYEEPFDNGNVEDFDFKTEDIYYSIAKIDGEIVEDFVLGQSQSITK